MNEPRIIVALDFSSATDALNLALHLDPALCRLKVGKELFTAAGPKLVERLTQAGFEIFLDLKFHDIPNTVAQACKSAAELGVWMVDVHALGGRAMLSAAREALESATHRPKLVAVTLLTSMGPRDLEDLGIIGEPDTIVIRWAGLARECGLDGVVCSPREAMQLRARYGPDFNLVTPGIRPASSDPNDQVRIATPRQAMDNGSDFLVIGRPVTRAPDPLQALREIHREITVAP